jgi:hypothetical protein
MNENFMPSIDNKEREPTDQAPEPVSNPDVAAPVETTVIQEAPEPPHSQDEAVPLETAELSGVDDGDIHVEDLEAPVSVEDNERSTSLAQEGGADETEESDNDESGALVGDSERFKVKKRSFLFRFLDSHGCGYIAHFPERWPRTFWFWFGVVAPLWMLIGIATVCGYGLAKLEAPQEIVTNDNRLEINYRVGAVELITNRVMESMPRICMRLYQKNSTTPEAFPQLDYEEGYYESAILLEQATNVYLNDDDDDDGTGADWVIDGNELFEFMSQCGKNSQTYISRIQAAGVVYVGEPAALTFNWARCVNDTENDGILGQMTVDLPFLGEKTYEALHPVSEK